MLFKPDSDIIPINEHTLRLFLECTTGYWYHPVAGSLDGMSTHPIPVRSFQFAASKSLQIRKFIADSMEVLEASSHCCREMSGRIKNFTLDYAIDARSEFTVFGAAETCIFPRRSRFLFFKFFLPKTRAINSVPLRCSRWYTEHGGHSGPCADARVYAPRQDQQEGVSKAYDYCSYF